MSSLQSTHLSALTPSKEALVSHSHLSVHSGAGWHTVADLPPVQHLLCLYQVRLTGLFCEQSYYVVRIHSFMLHL
jgi:hypothetical protein